MSKKWKENKMRVLKKITVEKDKEGYHVYLHWRKGLLIKRNYIVQTGETCRNKKEAIQIAKDWIAHKEWMEGQKIFKYECSNYIDLTRTTERGTKGEEQ